LLYLDQSIISSPEFQQINEQLVQEIPGMIDALDFTAYRGLVEFFRVVYVPYFV